MWHVLRPRLTASEALHFNRWSTVQGSFEKSNAIISNYLFTSSLLIDIGRSPILSLGWHPSLLVTPDSTRRSWPFKHYLLEYSRQKLRKQLILISALKITIITATSNLSGAKTRFSAFADVQLKIIRDIYYLDWYCSEN